MSELFFPGLVTAVLFAEPDIEGPQCMQTAQVVAGLTTTDLTGMTLALDPGNYRFRFQMVYRTSGTLVAAKFALAFSGVCTLAYTLTQFTSTATLLSVVGGLLDTLLGGSTGPGGTDVGAYYEGVCQVSTAGNLKVQGAASGLPGSTATFQLGSNGGAFLVPVFA